jgi:hypothetical protein
MSFTSFGRRWHLAKGQVAEAGFVGICFPFLFFNPV